MKIFKLHWEHKKFIMLLGIIIISFVCISSIKAYCAEDICNSNTARFPGTFGKYHDFDSYSFLVNGCNATVVVPAKALPGKPWIWRAEFFDAFPQVDLALLAKGYHLAFIDVGNTFGCPDALKNWDVFYKELTTKHGLSKKPALEGLSRGGLYIYNWAAINTDKVGCLFGDAPVCDFKSWPGGKGKSSGSVDDWNKLIYDYHFSSEAEALAYKKNPIDNLKPIAKAHIPIIHIYGDVDTTVPYEENTAIIAERYRKLGGKIKVIAKKGVGHHPHGLEDPTLVVDFIMTHCK